MQISGAGHSLGVSSGRTTGFGSCFSGSDVNSDPRVRISRCGAGVSDRGAPTRFLPAGTLARRTGVSEECPSAGAALLTDMSVGAAAEVGRSGLTPSALKAIGLGDTRPSVAI